MYTITVNVAKIGSLKSDGSRSLVGHVWLTGTDANGNKYDIGYQPEVGPVTNDSEVYINPAYQKTVEISEGQFQSFMEFRNNSHLYGFPANSHGWRIDNTCVDMSYAGLEHMGFQVRGIDRDIFPGNNTDSFDQFVFPYGVLPRNISPYPFRPWYQDYECVDNWCKLNRSGQSRVVDPLALDLDGDGLETVAHNRFSGSLFDHSGEGIRTATGWLKGDDGFLVYDRNGNGLIDDGTELFGDSTLLADGSRAAHGYAALAEWDGNGDGKVDADDAGFASLRVWRDLNQDGISQTGELFTLADAGVLSLSLQYTTPNTHLGNGNFLAQSGSYTRTDGSTAQMGDLDLAVDRLFARHSRAVELTEEQMQAPNLRGMGRVRDLREATALSGSLADVLAAYSGAVNDTVWKLDFQTA